MEKNLEEEYYRFIKNFSQNYEIELGQVKGINAQRSFEGFVCSKAMSEQEDPIIGLCGIYLKDCIYLYC